MNHTIAAALRTLHLAGCNRPRRAARRSACPEPTTEDQGVTGCGWFDSSHELSCGLLVTEHASPDAVAPDLPLGGWIELHLSGWRPQLQPGVV
jgi:hypothetical protein